MSRPLLWRSAGSGLLLVAGIPASFIPILALQALGLQLAEGASQVVQVGIVGLTCAVFGWLWGRTISRIASASRPGRIALICGLVYAAITPVVILVLGALEEDLVANGHSPIPIHNLYTLLFVPKAFLVWVLLGGAMGLAEQGVRLGAQSAWRSGLAAMVTYLILNVLQDLLGRRVGGPNAAETATMITVTLVCDVGAAMVSSAVLGGWLGAAVRRRGAEEQGRS